MSDNQKIVVALNEIYDEMSSQQKMLGVIAERLGDISNIQYKELHEIAMQLVENLGRAADALKNINFALRDVTKRSNVGDSIRIEQ